MTITHRLARTSLAPIFINGGIDAFRNPHERAKLADPVTRWIAKALGLPDDPVMLVKVNAAVQVGAGSLLAVGRLPRLTSAVLAGSLIPTTIAGHRFWDEADPARRTQQRTQLFKNMAVLGGLLLAATDTDGAPSLRWRAKRAAGSSVDSLTSLVAGSSGHHLPHVSMPNLPNLPNRPNLPSLPALSSVPVLSGLSRLSVADLPSADQVMDSAKDAARDMAGVLGHTGDRVLSAAAGFAERAAESAAHLGTAIGDGVSHAADVMAGKATALAAR